MKRFPRMRIKASFLSFLIGTQIVARAEGGREQFRGAADVMIAALTR